MSRPWFYECGPEDPNGISPVRWLAEELSYKVGPGLGGRWDPPNTHCEPSLIPRAHLHQPSAAPAEIRDLIQQ